MSSIMLYLEGPTLDWFIWTEKTTRFIHGKILGLDWMSVGICSIRIWPRKN